MTVVSYIFQYSTAKYTLFPVFLSGILLFSFSARAQNTLSGSDTFLCKGFEINGNTAFSDREVMSVLKIYTNRIMSTDELFRARDAVQTLYRHNGFVLSGVVIPDQEINPDGIIKIRVDEGMLSEIRVSSDRLRSSYIQGRLMTNPVSIRTIEKKLRLLKQSPLIENISAKLYPDLEPGKAVLDVEAEEAEPCHIRFGTNNHNSPSVGSYRAEISLRHDNLTGRGDTIKAEYGLTEGLDDYSASYSVPITRWATTLSLSFDRNEAKVISEPFEPLDIESDTDRYQVNLRHPLYKSPETEFTFSFGYEKVANESFLLGLPYSFSEKSENGEYDLDILSLSLDFVTRKSDQVFAVALSADLGNNYKTWLVQSQWSGRYKGMRFKAGADLQLSADTLPPSEKLSIGGHDTVRGYRENQAVADCGSVISAEWHIPLFTKHLKFITFYDYGRVWDDKRAPETDAIISSFGFGLDLRWKNIHAEGYWGIPMKNIHRQHQWYIQDNGIHLKISVDII